MTATWVASGARGLFPGPLGTRALLRRSRHATGCSGTLRPGAVGPNSRRFRPFRVRERLLVAKSARSGPVLQPRTGNDAQKGRRGRHLRRRATFRCACDRVSRWDDHTVCRVEGFRPGSTANRSPGLDGRPIARARRPTDRPGSTADRSPGLANRSPPLATARHGDHARAGDRWPLAASAPPPLGVPRLKPSSDIKGRRSRRRA